MLTSESPLQARAHDTSKARPKLAAEVIVQLRRNGYVVVDDVLTTSELETARADADGLGGFDSTWQHGDAVRTDSIRWWSEDGLGTQSPRLGLTTAVRRLRGFASELAASPSTAEKKFGCPPQRSMEGGWDGFDAARCDARLGVPLACQLALYEAEGEGQLPRYRPHRDGLAPEIVPRWSLRALEKAGTSAREVTAILYLNRPGAFGGGGRDDADVNNDEGGELVLYLDTESDDVTGKSASEKVLINPVGGRLVLFDSRRMLHEVLPHTCAAPRLALTSWFGGRWGFQWP